MSFNISAYVMGGCGSRTGEYWGGVSHGLLFVVDELRRGGVEVGWVDKSGVCDVDLLLVSVSSFREWWEYLRQRELWSGFKGVVLVGGAGVLNVGPVLHGFDVALFGRSDGLVVPLVKSICNGERFVHPSVLYSDAFDVDGGYELHQAAAIYPHEIELTNGGFRREVSIGCARACYFCGYTWHRAPVSLQSGRSYSAGNVQEHTLLDLDVEHPETWPAVWGLNTIAIDGSSERLRYSVNKRISRDRWRKFLMGLAKCGKPRQIKVYNILGLPGETVDDWRELVDDLDYADACTGRLMSRWAVGLANSHFIPMPGTPAACWPASFLDYRTGVPFYSAVRSPSISKGRFFYEGNAFYGIEERSTRSLAAHALDMLLCRGGVEHAETVRLLARNRTFWNASSAVQLATLDAACDIRELYRAYRPEQLPSRYLRTRCKACKGPLS